MTPIRRLLTPPYTDAEMGRLRRTMGADWSTSIGTDVRSHTCTERPMSVLLKLYLCSGYS